MVRSILFLFSALVQVGFVGAQPNGTENNMMLFGIVDDQRSGKPLPNVCVRVYTDSIAGDSVFTDPAGKYQTFVPLNGVHRVVYSMRDHHRKVVQVDATGEMDAAARAQEWNLRVDISLLAADQTLPGELLDTPIGIAEWVPAMRQFQWDQPYTERYKKRYKEAVKEASKK